MNPKKELKEFINENGFFLQIDKIEQLETNDIKDGILESNSIKTNEKIPQREGILVFRGLATQRFGKGEMSRNQYKILPEGWDFVNYVKNAQILLGHNPDNPIGKALEIFPHKAGVDLVYYVDLNWMNEVDRNRMRGGGFSGLSTGHITKEIKFENAETGELLTEEEAEEKYGVDRWDLLFSDAWIMVVSKAEAVEVSAVTIPSNPDALTMQNSLQKFFSSHYRNEYANLKMKNGSNFLYPISNPSMNIKDNDGQEPETQEPETEAQEPEASQETQEEAPEVKEPENGEQKEETPENGEASKNSHTQENGFPKDVENLLVSMANALVSMNVQINTIKTALKNIPAKEALSVSSQFGIIENSSENENSQSLLSKAIAKLG